MKCSSGLAEAQAWMGFAHSQAAPPGRGPALTSCLIPLLVTAGSVQGLRPSVRGFGTASPEAPCSLSCLLAGSAARVLPFQMFHPLPGSPLPTPGIPTSADRTHQPSTGRALPMRLSPLPHLSPLSATSAAVTTRYGCVPVPHCIQQNLCSNPQRSPKERGALSMQRLHRNSHPRH